MALIEIKMANNEQERRMTLQVLRLLQARKYRVEIAVSARRVCTTLMAILDTGVGTKLINEKFILAVQALLLKTAKASRLRSASNNAMEVKGVINLHLQAGQLH